jgi:hypothetical protein
MKAKFCYCSTMIHVILSTEPLIQNRICVIPPLPSTKDLAANAQESVLNRVTQQIIPGVNNAVEIFKSTDRTPPILWVNDRSNITGR